MNSPLLGSLAATIGKSLRGLFIDAMLTRDVPGTGGDPFDPPPATSTSFPCKAVVETYADKFRLEGLVDQKDRKVLILATSLDVVPTAGDRITIRGITFTVMEVGTDPAQAVWECKARS